MQNIDYKIYPKFRENIWRFTQDNQKAYLITSDGAFEVDSEDASTFLKMRPYCTGHNNIKEVALKSGIDLKKIESIIETLHNLNIVYPATESHDNEEKVKNKFINICKIWAEELKINFIGNKLMEGKLPKQALIGWLIEMYHYITDFPNAIDVAANYAEGELKALLIKYANEERHHNIYVLRTLKNLGIKEEEVKSTTPMLSTRLIGFLMRELFQLSPSSVLLMAALIVIEASEFEDQIDLFNDKMKNYYNTPDKAFEPYFDHQNIDAKLGHANLLKDNLHLLKFDSLEIRDLVVNKLHDLKHAFDLMGMEIDDYYKENTGRYFPRQPIYFNAI